MILFAMTLWVAGGSRLHAQSGLEYAPSSATRGLSPVAVLGGEWVDEDHKPLAVPFVREDRQSMLVQRWFELPGFEKLPDSLFLYFEGVAWTAEVYLNKRLIGITEDPFSEYLFLVEKELFLPAGNVLEIRMTLEGLERPYYPKHFLGVFRQVLVMKADPLAVAPSKMRWAKSTKKALMIAPWSKESGVLNDTAVIDRMLEGLFSVPPGLPVTFAFRPSNHSLEMIARKGVAVVPEGVRIDSIGFYNAYPIGSAPKPLTTPFWRTMDSRPTGYYGMYSGLDEISAPLVMPLDKLALVIFLFLPILLMLLLKLLLPRVFDTLAEYLTRGKIYMELIASNKFLKDEHRLFMNLIRITFLALTVSLFLYYLSVTGTWGRLNLLSSQSLLYGLFSGSKTSLYLLFVECWIFIAILTLAKYFLLNFIAGVYRIHGFSSAIQSLDIFASFPLNILPLVPGAVIFFLSADQGDLLVGIWYGLMVLYWLRRLYLVYTGLTRLFNLPLSLKILYICTLEISPWIFLL